MTQPANKRLVRQSDLGLLGPSNGTDDTTWLNAVLTTNRTVRGLAGQTYLISAPLVVRSGTVLDMTGCTVQFLPGSTGNMLTNYQVAANNGRDSAISITGGTWDRGSAGGTGTGNHSLMFRRIDGLTIRNLTVKSTAGKFAIAPGDVTNFVIANITFATASDGVHVSGPARAGVIRDIFGTTGDDSVAFTGNDYAYVADVHGDMSDIVVENVRTSTNQNLVKVLPGVNQTADNFSIRDVVGTANNGGVWIGDDTNDANTTGGTIGTIVVERVKFVPTNGAFAVLLRGSTILNAVLRDIDYTPAVADKAGIFCASNSIKALKVDGYRVRGSLTAANAVQISGSTIDRMTLNNFHMADASTAANAFLLTSGTIKELEFNDAYCVFGGNSSALIELRSTFTLTKVNISGGYYETLGRIIHTASTTPACTMSVRGAMFKTPNRLADLSSPLDVSLSGITVDTPSNPLLYANGSTATVTLRGEQPITVGTVTLLGRSGTQTLRTVGLTIKADLTILTPADGDMVSNTNATPTCGVGPAVYNTTAAKWKGLYSGLTN